MMLNTHQNVFLEWIKHDSAAYKMTEPINPFENLWNVPQICFRDRKQAY